MITCVYSLLSSSYSSLFLCMPYHHIILCCVLWCLRRAPCTEAPSISQADVWRAVTAHPAAIPLIVPLAAPAPTLLAAKQMEKVCSYIIYIRISSAILSIVSDYNVFHPCNTRINQYIQAAQVAAAAVATAGRMRACPGCRLPYLPHP